ncbi:MAG TPA: cytochrome c [Stellaceae bacterium]|nr:cytochrome c [Stellaceae bacterium]
MRLLATIGILAILVVIGAAIYFFGGYYSVAAAKPNPGIIDWALVRIRVASIEHRAPATSPVRLDDPAVVREGARAYSELGCVNCHGAPGVDWAKFSEGLRPDPPDLKDAAKELEPGEIFWVVKNGINMTGMPSFGLIKTEDKKIWAIAAFVKKLPTISPDDYKAWSEAAAGHAPAK